MDRFTRLTQEKVASAMSLTYGDQGPLSLAQVVQPLAGAAAAAIPVKFVAPPLDGAGRPHGGGGGGPVSASMSTAMAPSTTCGLTRTAPS